MAHVLYRRDAGPVGSLTFVADEGGAVRPSPVFFAALGLAAAELAGDSGAVAGVLRSQDPQFLRDFTASDWLALRAAFPGAADLSDALGGLAQGLRQLETCGKPVVALVAGNLTGAAAELALAAHARVCPAGAVLRLPSVAIGVLPALGGAQRLCRLAGIPASLPVLLNDQSLDLAAVGLAMAGGEDDAMALAATLGAEAEGALQPWDRRGFRVPGGAGPSAPHAMASFMAGTSRLKAAAPRYPAPLALLASVWEGTQLGFDAGARIATDYAAEVLAGEVAGNLLSLAGPAPADGPGVTAIRAALEQAVGDLLAAGHPAGLVRNALLQAGIDVEVEADPDQPVPTGDLPTAAQLAGQVLAAGGRAATDAVQAGLFANAAQAGRASLRAGFPAWTGGAIAWGSAGRAAW